MKKAKWGVEYDMHTDKTYTCPVCPECGFPVVDLFGNCPSCGEKFILTVADKEWLNTHTGSKVEKETCPSCGGEMEVIYLKNPVNLEWDVFAGKCECGMSFIV